MHLRNSGSKRPQRKVDVPRLRYDFQDHREARQVGPPQGVAHQRKTPSIEKTVEKTPCRLAPLGACFDSPCALSTCFCTLT